MMTTPLNPAFRGSLVMGVDPGFSGAISLVNRFDPSVIVQVYDFPIKEVKGKRHVDPMRLASCIDFYADQTAYAMVEEVGVMTGREGTVGMFRFGYVAGLISGILAASHIPMFFTKPAVWKSAMGLGRNKNDSRALASKKFPAHTDYWKRVKDDGRAEASLLAYFGATRLK